ncbi:MAG TPA: response regulator [Thermoanaerobaculia bacterium]|nr:response regulator [Thermoanaerobaculia bacterium]
MNSPKTALVVDDDPSTRLLLQKFLARSGYEVEVAQHGGEAVEMLAESDYGVIMLDLMMPILDGLGVLEFLRERRPEQVGRVVIVTAYPRQLDASELGVCAIVSKPFTFDVLTGVLASV